jgi:hypothetical protein
VLAAATGIALVSAVAVLRIEQKHKAAYAKFVLGTKDEVFYSGKFSEQDAAALAQALHKLGFFRDEGASVFLSRRGGVTGVSFAMHEDSWKHEETVAALEQMGRLIAPEIGGFPIEVRVTDSDWNIEKSMTVGKLDSGARDSIYYFGSATKENAEALGHALSEAGYLVDAGVSVALFKDKNTSVGFVLRDGVWQQSNSVVQFENLVRRIAPRIGGLPVELLFMDGGMDVKKRVNVH